MPPAIQLLVASVLILGCSGGILYAARHEMQDIYKKLVVAALGVICGVIGAYGLILAIRQIHGDA